MLFSVKDEDNFLMKTHNALIIPRNFGINLNTSDAYHI